MAKKKKTQLKPVARPFATASVPKKVVEEPVVPEDEQEAAVPSEEANGQAVGPGALGVPAKDAEESEEVKALKKEEAALQGLVEKLQDKTEKEINRTIKGLEYDRRLAKSLTPLSMDPVLRTRVFKLWKEEESEADATTLPTLDDAAEKVLLRIGIVYGVLMRLGFSEERVLECLRALPSFEVDDAFDWLYVHCDEDELDFEKEKVTEALEDVQTPMPQTPRTPMAFQMAQGQGQGQGQGSPAPAESQAQAQAQASTRAPVTPSPLSRRQSSASASASAFTAASDEGNTLAPPPPLPAQGIADFKSRIMSAYAQQQQQQLQDTGADADAESAASTVSGAGSDMTDLDPNAEYAKLKLRIFQRGPPDTSETSAANAADQARIAEIRQHYFFKEKDAEAEFRKERTRVLNAAKEARLRDPTAPLPVASSGMAKKNRKARPPSLLPSVGLSSSGSPKKSASDIPTDTSSEGSGEGGTMFGTMLDEMPTSEVVPGVNGADNTTVRIRDMSLPKQWGGRTPKVLLAEIVHKQDRYAAVSYFLIGGAITSRAVRSGVSVRWGNPGSSRQKAQEWRMDEDGCHDQAQSEQFIATVALHALTFATKPGFANSAVSGGGPQTHFRVLPPVYRDLWDELEAKRKEAEDAANRLIWRRLKEIIEPRLGSAAKPTKSSKPAAPVDDPADHWDYRLGAPDQQIADTFRARQMTQSYQEMFVHRMNLPIAPYRNEIVTTLDASQVMVLSGETGCGKSTQVPAFILEEQLSRGQHCKIFCTEPRRISAISLAQRVSLELGDAPGQVGTMSSMVGYSIRLESNTSRNTRLAYVTNGIALRMLEAGSGPTGKGTAFDEITHIIIDEVHERSIESDFLLIVLKSLLEQRPNLKVVLMSATLDAEKISAYFGGCPILRVPGRTFPVDVRFLEDAVELTQWTIKENSPYAKRLNDSFHKNGKQVALEWNEDTVAADDDDDENSSNETGSPKLEPRYSQPTVNTVNLLDERNIPYDLIVRLMETICYENESYIPFSAAILVFMPGMNEIRRLHDMLTDHDIFGNAEAFRIMPLHSTISSENQSAVFDLPPVGVRKIVISTNIAETGITIPDITCVIDSGKHREMRFDEKRQISRLVETYIAKSNAAQRRGRAGRVQSGLCFHLFTKFRHDNMLADHPLPEMMRLSLSDLALRTKILKVKIGGTIEEVLSRALDPPAQINIQRAVAALVEVKALTTSEDITPMGRLLSKLPTDVHLGKFLLTAALFRCLDPALTIAATLNSKSPFVSPFGHEQEADRAKAFFKVESSDFLTIHAAFSSWRKACANPGNVRTYCRKNFLSHQNLQQIEELRQQFLGYLIDSSFIEVDRAFEKELSRTRYGRGKVKFVSVPAAFDQNSKEDNILNAALVAGLYPKVLSVDPSNGQLRTLSNNQPAAFHPSSVNFRRRPGDLGVNHLSYFTIMHSKRLYAWETGPVDDLAMLLLCGDADFKLSSNSTFLDRKIKFFIAPKTNMALKILRARFSAVLATQMRGKPLTAAQQEWHNLALLVLSKVPVELDAEEAAVVRAAPSVDIIF